MSVTLKLVPTGVIKARLGIEKGGRVQKYFTNTCARYMDKYVPYAEGPLRINVETGDDYVEYRSPHAHYQYIGEKFVDPITGKGAFYSPDFGFWSRPNTKKVSSGIPLNYHTPGTGSYWDKKMWTAEGNDVIKEVEEYMKRGGN
jgi:hypothetical protein